MWFDWDLKNILCDFGSRVDNLSVVLCAEDDQSLCYEH